MPSPPPFEFAADRPAWLAFVVIGLLMLLGAGGGLAMASAGFTEGDAETAVIGALMALTNLAILAAVPTLAGRTVTHLRWDGRQLHVVWATGRRAAFARDDFAELHVRALPHGCRAVRVRCRDAQVVAISNAGRAMGVRSGAAVAALIALASNVERRDD
jgi:hypothetical protein